MSCHVAIIPARMGSSRFPGKPLELIGDKPMLWHVYQSTKGSQMLSGVFIATCDAEIETYCSSIGAPCIMTSPDHERCTDRIAEALPEVESRLGQSTDIVVLVQGDEPMIQGDLIDRCIQSMNRDSNIEVMNCICEIHSDEEFYDRNEIKVVLNKANEVLYFSREPIPSSAKCQHPYKSYKQVCVIPFRRDFLRQFNAWPETPLEAVESVDMLRILEHGHSIPTMRSENHTFSVDTPDDLRRVACMMLDEQFND